MRDEKDGEYKIECLSHRKINEKQKNEKLTKSH